MFELILLFIIESTPLYFFLVQLETITNWRLGTSSLYFLEYVQQASSHRNNGRVHSLVQMVSSTINRNLLHIQVLVI